MPYRDKGKDRGASKERMRRHRQKGVTSEGVTSEGVTSEGVTENGTFFKDGIEMVPASYVQGLNGRMYQSLPSRPRFLTLSDGQVFDRLNQPQANGIKVHQIRVSNESCYNFHPSEGKITKELRDAIK